MYLDLVAFHIISFTTYYYLHECEYDQHPFDDLLLFYVVSLSVTIAIYSTTSRYVGAVDDEGAVFDVTPRYASLWLTDTEKCRPDNDWWQVCARMHACSCARLVQLVLGDLFVTPLFL